MVNKIAKIHFLRKPINLGLNETPCSRNDITNSKLMSVHCRNLKLVSIHLSRKQAMSSRIIADIKLMLKQKDFFFS